MAEYVEREALLKEIGRRKSIARTSFPKQNFCVNDVLHCIYDATTADVVEVRHGEWSVVEKNKEKRTLLVECSECSGIFELSMFTFGLNYNYCPNCGAEMDGKGEG